MNSKRKNEYIDPDEVAIVDYIKVIVKRRWLIIGVTIFSMLFTVIFATVFSTQQLYQAKSVILTDEQSDYLKTGIDDNIISVAPQQTYIAIINSNQFLRKVVGQTYAFISDNERTEGDLITFYGAGEYAAVQQLKSTIRVESNQGGLLELSVTTADPGLSASVANEIIDQLNIYNQEQRNSNAKLNLQFIENRLREIEQELNDARNTLVSFLNKNKQLSLVDTGRNNPFPILTVEKGKLDQEVNLKANLYNTLSNQYELAKIEAQKEIPVITVIEYAEPPVAPLPGNIMRNASIAFLVGLFVSVTLAFILNYIEGIDKETKGFFSEQFQKEKKLLSLLLRNGSYKKIEDKKKHRV